MDFVIRGMVEGHWNANDLLYRAGLKAYKRLTFALLFVLAAGVLPACNAQTVTVGGSHVQDAAGNLCANCRIFFAPVDSNGRPLSFRVGGSGGQVLSKPVWAQVTNGVFTITLPDVTQTSPVNACFKTTITDLGAGVSALSQGYSCVQPGVGDWCSAGACNFDSYTPNTPGLPVDGLQVTHNGSNCALATYSGGVLNIPPCSGGGSQPPSGTGFALVNNGEWLTPRALVSGDIPNNSANTSGTAAGLSAASALPDGTSATTQTTSDASTKLATDGFVKAAIAAASLADLRPNVTQSTGKNGFLAAGGTYQIFNATGAGTITEVHVTLGASGSDTPNLVENSALQIACDGNLQSVPFGLFFTAMDLPKPYNTDYLSIPVMSTTFPGTNNGAMVFNRRTWINFTSGCTMTLVNASATATANVFVDTTYKSGTPMAAPNAPTTRAYWNAYPSYLAAVPPNSGTFNTPQVYLLPSSALGTGEVEAITYFVNSSPNLNYLESGPVVICDGVICNQSGGGEDWGLTGYYGNYAANENVTSRGGFLAGTFLQTQQGGNDALIYRRYDVQPVDNLPFTSSLAVSSANGTSAISTSPSVAMSALTSFWTNNPTASVVQYSPAAGTFSSTQSVALTSYPAGASTCYTTDGTTPTATAGSCTHGTTYASAISVPSTATIKALSTKSGFNNGILSSALYTINSYTAPTFATSCGTVGGAGGATTVSCTLTASANDFAYVMCRSGGAAGSYTVTASPSSSFTQMGYIAGVGGSHQASYGVSLVGGSTTVTCHAGVSMSFLSIEVLDYHTTSTPTLLTSQVNSIGSSTSTATSSALTTSQPALVIGCANPEYAASSATVGTINGSAANNRTVNTSAASLCQDLFLATGATSFTSVLSAGPGGTWDINVAAFH